MKSSHYSREELQSFSIEMLNDLKDGLVRRNIGEYTKSGRYYAELSRLNHAISQKTNPTTDFDHRAGALLAKGFESEGNK